MSRLRRKILSAMKEVQIIYKEYDDRSIPDLNGFIQAATHQINGGTSAGNKMAVVKIDGGDTYELSMNVYSGFRMASTPKLVKTYEKVTPSVYVISPYDLNTTASLNGKRSTLQITTKAGDNYLYIFYWTDSIPVSYETIRDSISVHNITCPEGQ